MVVTSKWRLHIEAWQRSGLSQATYCAQQQIIVKKNETQDLAEAYL